MLLHRICHLQSLRCSAVCKFGLAQLLPIGLETLLQPVQQSHSCDVAYQITGCIVVRRALHCSASQPGWPDSFHSTGTPASTSAAVPGLHAQRSLSTQAAAKPALHGAGADPRSRQPTASAGVHAAQRPQPSDMQRQAQTASSSSGSPSASGDAGSAPQPADTWAAQPQPPDAAPSPATAADETTDHSSEGRVFVYHAPLSTTVRRLKVRNLLQLVSVQTEAR